MLSDFEMILHEFNQPISIFPISDVHYGALEHLIKLAMSYNKKIEVVW